MFFQRVSRRHAFAALKKPGVDRIRALKILQDVVFSVLRIIVFHFLGRFLFRDIAFGIDADYTIHVYRACRQLEIEASRSVVNVRCLCDLGYDFLRCNRNYVRSDLQIIRFAVKIESRSFAVRIYVSLYISVFCPILRFQTLSVFQKFHNDAAIRRGGRQSDGFFTVHDVFGFKTLFHRTPIDAAVLEILQQIVFSVFGEIARFFRIGNIRLGEHFYVHCFRTDVSALIRCRVYDFIRFVFPDDIGAGNRIRRNIRARFIRHDAGHSRVFHAVVIGDGGGNDELSSHLKRELVVRRLSPQIHRGSFRILRIVVENTDQIIHPNRTAFGFHLKPEIF